MTEDQYEVLVGLARQGIGTADGQREFEVYIRTIEESSGVNRYFLWVRWQELGEVAPANQRFPQDWPPNREIKIERINTPITRAIVDEAVAARSNNPFAVLVTPDPGGELGWSNVDQYFQ
jgi:hypothetical protein